MAAAETIVQEPMCLPMADQDEALMNLIHDLRQPLSAMEAIAFYLDLRLQDDQTEAREYVLQLQRLVADAGAQLTQAVAEFRQRAAAL